jgi:asparagine synthase (glutamine-hydrolysing)
MTFAAPEFDDSLHQEAVAAAVGSEHTVSAIRMDTIAQSLPQVLWHTETPLLKTAPALMYHLAKLAKESGLKAVVGGDGADEIFLGNDVFREASVRRFCMRRPDSLGRQRLFDRVYSETTQPPRGSESWAPLLDCAEARDPLFSHLPRFLSSRFDEYYSPDFKAGLGGIDVIGELRASLPTRFFAWAPLNQAAFLEMTTRLSPYLLSSHGDRMTMAHGVEGRYPFLDHRVFEFVSALPTGSRLRGLRGKEVLRRWASRILPSQMVLERRPGSRPPDAQCFFLSTSPSWVGDHLTSEALRRVGVFSAPAVGGLVRRCHAGLTPPSEDNRSLIGVLSTQLWHHQFVESALSISPLPLGECSVLLSDNEPGSRMEPTLTKHANTRI